MGAPTPAAVRTQNSTSSYATLRPPTERVAGPGWHAEDRKILDTLAYARRLGVSRKLLQRALKVKLEAMGASGNRVVDDPPLQGTAVEERRSVRALADRIAYPTDWVQNRSPMPLWYVADIESYEQENGVVTERPDGRWVRRPQRLSGYPTDELVRATSDCGLTEEESAVIVGRYGLDGSPSVSQAALADVLGVSERTVRNMEQRASERVAARLESQGAKRLVQAVPVAKAPPQGCEEPSSLPCARCLTPKSAYAAPDAMLCSSCEKLYERVHDEVCREQAALKAQADKFSFYVGDCRPYRRAFMLNLPLYALNRLARAVDAEDRGYGYAASGALRAGELVYAGNIELLGETWHYGAKRLREGFEHLKSAGKIERRGLSPKDPRIEFWVVLAPYERPNLNVALRRGRRLIPQ